MPKFYRRVPRKGVAYEKFTSRPIVTESGKEIRCLKGGRNVAVHVTVDSKDARTRKYLQALLVRLGCNWETIQNLGRARVLLVVGTQSALQELTNGSQACVLGWKMPTTARVGIVGQGDTPADSVRRRPQSTRDPADTDRALANYYSVLTPADFAKKE